MTIEIEFISKEFIKPSSPTPHHLSKLQFSFIDQSQFPISMPFVLFYEKSNISNQERSILLKQSLAKALTIFYPLAGRINNYSYADCNDEGALFIEAKTSCNLSDILENRHQYHNHSNMFIPLQPDKSKYQYGSLFQITFFNCGGTAVSFAMPHMLGDALSMFTFLNGWATVARGNKVDVPSFGSASIFPPKNISGFDLTQSVFKENVVTKSFRFDASTISALRNRYSAKGEKLSRVLALSVFLLSRLIATTSQAKEASKNNRYMVVNSANVRKLVDPPLSKHSFGNFIWAAPTMIDNMEDIGKENQYQEIGRRIKDSIKSVNAESLKKLQNGEFNFDKETFMECMKGDIVRYSFASVCHFPMYDVDFGWGKPEWVATSALFFNNFILLCDIKERHGIEAWISLTEKEMAKFEIDKLLLSHLPCTPSPNGKQILNSRL